MPETIYRFTGEYRFLSNFYPCRVYLEGRRYPTVEHAYQAAKFRRNKRVEVRKASTPGAAKRLGRYADLLPHWDKRKVQIMRRLVGQKFHPDLNPALSKLLRDTYPSALVEGNEWGDVFWGVCGGKGQNTLGQILTSIRDDLMCDWRLKE